MAYTLKAGDKVLINPQDEVAAFCAQDTTIGGVYELTGVFTDLEVEAANNDPVFVVFTDDIGDTVHLNEIDVTLFKLKDEGE